MEPGTPRLVRVGQTDQEEVRVFVLVQVVALVPVAVVDRIEAPWTVAERPL